MPSVMIPPPDLVSVVLVRSHAFTPLTDVGASAGPNSMPERASFTSVPVWVAASSSKTGAGRDSAIAMDDAASTMAQKQQQVASQNMMVGVVIAYSSLEAGSAVLSGPCTDVWRASRSAE
eukprot:SAG31_NODE_6653_length_1936_cov_2.868263_1_plen_120_part_00